MPPKPLSSPLGMLTILGGFLDGPFNLVLQLIVEIPEGARTCCVSDKSSFPQGIHRLPELYTSHVDDGAYQDTIPRGDVSGEALSSMSCSSHGDEVLGPKPLVLKQHDALEVDNVSAGLGKVI